MKGGGAGTMLCCTSLCGDAPSGGGGPFRPEPFTPIFNVKSKAEQDKLISLMFHAADLDNSGALSEAEVVETLSHGYGVEGIYARSPRFMQAWAAADKDGSGKIELGEFEKMLCGSPAVLDPATRAVLQPARPGPFAGQLQEPSVDYLCDFYWRLFQQGDADRDGGLDTNRTELAAVSAGAAPSCMCAAAAAAAVAAAVAAGCMLSVTAAAVPAAAAVVLEVLGAGGGAACGASVLVVLVHAAHVQRPLSSRLLLLPLQRSVGPQVLKKAFGNAIGKDELDYAEMNYGGEIDEVHQPTACRAAAAHPLPCLSLSLLSAPCRPPPSIVMRQNNTRLLLLDAPPNRKSSSA